MSGDVTALAELMADDLVHIHGSGQIENKTSYLNGVQTRFIFHRIERGELDIRVHGDCAIVVGTLDQVIEVRGTEKLNDVKAMVSQFWVRSADGWQQNTCHMHFLSIA
jgi:ketosteroid isomerase-like protein